MGKKSKKWILFPRWIARIWSLGPILFGLTEILFPHSEPDVEVALIEWMMLWVLGIAVIGLGIGWRWERVGGWLSLAALGVLTIPFIITVERSVPTIFIFWVGIGTPAVLYLLCAYYDGETKSFT